MVLPRLEAGARMTITRGQLSGLAATGGASSLNVTWGTNPAAGSKILVAVFTGSAIPNSVTDNGTSPATFTRDVTDTARPNKAFIYRGDNITLPGAGSYTVTVTVAS